MIFVRFRFTEILISSSGKWVNQKRFAKAKEMKGTYFNILFVRLLSNLFLVNLKMNWIHNL